MGKAAEEADTGWAGAAMVEEAETGSPSGWIRHCSCSLEVGGEVVVMAPERVAAEKVAEKARVVEEKAGPAG